MARMVAPCTDTDRVIQRVIIRLLSMTDAGDSPRTARTGGSRGTASSRG
jgi:hypothetical protein